MLQAASDPDFLHVTRLTLRECEERDADAGFCIIGDLREQALPVLEPADLPDRMVAAG